MSRSRRPPGISGPDLHVWLARNDPLILVADRNEVLETLGHDPRTPDGEAAWLHRLGPSAMFAHRRLVSLLETVGDGHGVPLAALASELGLPGGSGRNSKVVHVLARLVDYGIATPRDGGLAVTFALPPARRVAPNLEDSLTPPASVPSRPACALRPGIGRTAQPTMEVSL